MNYWNTHFRSKIIGILLLGVICCISPAELTACSYKYKLAMFNNALDRYNQLVADGASQIQLDNAARALCNIRRGIEGKFRDRPGFETPDIPSDLGIDCEALANTFAPPGGGRGGTTGGSAGPGGTATQYVWMRNFQNQSCEFSWNITMTAGDPAHFTLSQTSGSLPVPAFADAPPSVDSVEVMISPNATPGETAVFKIEFMDQCTGLTFGEEYEEFTVTAVADFRMEPIEPVLPVPNTGTVTARWRVTNTTSATIVKQYFFRDHPDPFSQMTLNDTTLQYAITNVVATNKGNTGGSVTIPPNSSVIIEKEVQSTEVCDPQMMGCCALEIDGASCCVIMPTHRDDPVSQCTGYYELEGSPTFTDGLMLSIIGPDGQSYSVFGEPFPSGGLPQLLDQLAVQVLERFSFEDGFNFQPIVTGNQFFLMVPPETFWSLESLGENVTVNEVECNTHLVGIYEGSLEHSKGFSFRVAPTITRSDLNILVNIEESTKMESLILDLNGRVVYREAFVGVFPTGEHQFAIELPELTPGMYLLSLRSAGVIKTQKFIVP